MSRPQAVEWTSESADAVKDDNRSRSASLKSYTGKTRPRRKSSGLGAEPPGDTSAPAVSTLNHVPRTDHTPPLSPRSANTHRRSKRRKVRSFLRRWKNLSFTHTWVNPLILIVIVLSLYLANPSPSNPIHKALFLSYQLDSSDPLIPEWARSDALSGITYYGKGRADIAFVSFYIIVLSFTREFLMQRLIRPMAIRAGIRTRARQSRFMEQVYTAIYFAVFGPFGLYVMRHTPVWYFNTEAMYASFPHRAHDGLFKAYYLLQASYWAQQAIVLLLQLEKPRKDFKELVAHHVVTLALIALSYRFHFTYMGLAVYVTHDISDFFLATSKTLNYIDSPITTPYFCFFSLVWIYMRHWLNLCILYSITTTFKTVGPWELNWATQQYKCWLSQCITFALLAALQSLNLFWLYMILRIAYSAVFRSVAKDERSDDEDDTPTEEDERESREKELKELRASVEKASSNDRGFAEKVPEVRLNGHAVGASGGLQERVKENGDVEGKGTPSPRRNPARGKKENSRKEK